MWGRRTLEKNTPRGTSLDPGSTFGAVDALYHGTMAGPLLSEEDFRQAMTALAAATLAAEGQRARQGENGQVVDASEEAAQSINPEVHSHRLPGLPSRP